VTTPPPHRSWFDDLLTLLLHDYPDRHPITGLLVSAYVLVGGLVVVLLGPFFFLSWATGGNGWAKLVGLSMGAGTSG
jgi:hypothetical protein